MLPIEEPPTPLTDNEQQLEVMSVTELNQMVKLLLEDNFGTIWVEGEISNFAAPNSGHWYFTLKDTNAQVRCAMFRVHRKEVNFSPKDGMHILLRAKVSLYPNRGEYQLIAEFMEERGEGKLRRAYEILKKKLAAKGLFDSAHKKSLPSFPKQIGVITSATGAAIRDILIVLKKRFPHVGVIIYPTLVQGESAARTIVAAIRKANERLDCDVLILARGGGSLEDLWPFNEECVAYAIFDSIIPIISAIGHEVDFTIADFVADSRAPTPSAAAEMVVKDQVALSEGLFSSQQKLVKIIANFLMTRKQHLDWRHKHIQQQHPKKRLLEKMQQLDYLELSLLKLQRDYLNKLNTRLKDSTYQLMSRTPLTKIVQLKQTLLLQYQKNKTLMLALLAKKRATLANVMVMLDARSPLATLTRGYAMVSKKPNRTLIKSVNDISLGDAIDVTLADGCLICVVQRIDDST